MIEWKAIPGYEGFYEASKDGRIRSLPRMSRVNTKNKGVRRMGGNELKIVYNRLGYGLISLSANSKVKHFKLHQLILSTFFSKPFPGAICRHLNGNPSDNRIENLRWGTHKENAEDRAKHGRGMQGERHHQSKLTNEQALYIYSSDEPGIALAKRFGIWPTKISGIRRGKTYRCVTGGIAKPSRAKRPDAQG